MLDWKKFRSSRPARTCALLFAAGVAVGATAAHADEHSLDVTASAFNSVVNQTDADPNLTAWGDRLEPGMQAIAVSRDLIALGLKHGVRVKIDGLPGEYVVRDKMAARWKKKIDIYMGIDVAAAKRWGVRQVRIHWTSE
jgi:3D (Asp-Asp-Asp) domain-containing protein